MTDKQKVHIKYQALFSLKNNEKMIFEMLSIAVKIGMRVKLSADDNWRQFA